MKKLYILWRTLLRINFSLFVIYRGNFVGTVFTSLGWAVFSVVSMYLLISSSSTIFGWTKVELYVLTGVYSIVVGLFHVFFTVNFWWFPRIIHLGQLDGLLLKPVDTQFMLSSKYINFSTIPRVCAAILFTLYILYTNHIYVTFTQWIYFVLLVLVGLIILYSIWFIVMTILIWQSHLSNLSDLLFHVTDSAKYPKEMYEGLGHYLAFFLLPIALTVSLPAKVLFDRASLWDALIIISIAVSLFIFSRKFWKFALRFYTSASS